MSKPEQLEKAFSTQSAEAVEDALAEEIAAQDDCVPVLMKLLECDWHESHESIALSADSAVAGYVQRRLDRWEQEERRKGLED